jgi:hypothetical protein
MSNATRHEGNPRHRRHADYLYARGEITYEAAYLDERLYRVLGRFPAVGIAPKRKELLGVRLEQLRSSVKACPGNALLRELVGRLAAVIGARNDLMHSFALTGGAFRFDATAPNGVGRTYFSVADIERVRDGLMAASAVADMILGYSRCSSVPGDPDQAEYLELLGRVHAESDSLFTGLIDVLRNLGGHDERQLRLEGVGTLRGLLGELVKTWPRESKSLEVLLGRTEEVNRLRNHIVHSWPVEGHPYKLVSAGSGFFDVADREDLQLLAVELRQLWVLADNIVKDNAKNGGSLVPSYAQGSSVLRF